MAIRTNAGIAAFQEVASKINPTTNNAPSYNNSGGVFRLQALLNNRRYSQNGNNPPQQTQEAATANVNSTNPSDIFQAGAMYDNRGNLFISRDALGYNTPMSAEEQLKLVSKYEDKKLEKDTALAGVAALQNAFAKTGGFSTVFGSYNPR